MLTLQTDVVHTQTDYGTVLLDEHSGRYWTLNPTGTLVLRVLLGGGSTTEAADAIAESYDVDVATANRDVQALLTDLHAAGLVGTNTSF
ncbi:lasso peptide biosynthesis PqqD family chaperone [Protofrankia symbiont of Coriaria ruscifolia]|uniref:lasso peptide biosynthesis PqqD family chaperone n=1 Tax=Protofrankia symbiont of Coriaria ruscifolia TaxID=1306542 RepID=UPI0010412F57|nr:lasso peptide biosynthesis PqqD family chaperone [Protofrankia symbiont of Coriaria ruscifolia]